MSISKPNLSRRYFGIVLAAPVLLSTVRPTLAKDQGVLGLTRRVPEVEARSLEELQKAALAEGGDLIVYAGGDIPNAQAAVEEAFKEALSGYEHPHPGGP